MESNLALLTCLASTLYMMGVIWFVQVVHYPLFDQVGPDVFRRYHASHTRRTTPVVALPMLLELGSSLALVVHPPFGSTPGWTWAGLAASVVCWASTVVLSVPSHRRLASGFDRRTHRALVLTNLVRLAGWSAHALIVLGLTAVALRARD